MVGYLQQQKNNTISCTRFQHNLKFEVGKGFCNFGTFHQKKALFKILSGSLTICCETFLSHLVLFVQSTVKKVFKSKCPFILSQFKMPNVLSKPKILFEVHGSSHTTERRKMPDIMCEVFSCQNRYAMPIFERDPRFDHGGRKLTGDSVVYDFFGGRRVKHFTNNSVVYDLLKRMHDKSPSQQVNVVMLGANDFDFDIVPNWFLDLFFSCLEQLIESSVVIHNNHLVICSLVPRPKNSRQKDSLFKRVDQKMKRICQRNSQSVSFFDVSSLLRDENGKIISKYFKPDLVHMNEDGVRVVCEGVLRFVMLIDGDRIWQPSLTWDV